MLSFARPRRRGGFIAMLLAAVALTPLVAAGARAQAGSAQPTRVSVRVGIPQTTRYRQQYDSLLHVLDSTPMRSRRYEILLREVAERAHQIANMEQARAGDQQAQVLLGAVIDEDVRRGLYGPAGNVERTFQALLPGGTLGFSTKGISKQHFRTDGMYVRYYEYPSIDIVDPNTPADSAGIAGGDRLINYNGRDVREFEMNLTRMLEPSNTVTVTVMRNGRIQDFPLVVARANPVVQERRKAGVLIAAGQSVGVPAFPTAQNLSGMAGFLVEMLTDSLRSTRSASVRSGGGGAGGAGGAAGAAAGASAGGAAGAARAMVFSRSPATGSQLISGMELRDLNTQIRESLGLPEGVWIEQTNPASRAYAAGVRGGDVIVSVAGQRVRTSLELRQTLAAWQGERLPIEIVSNKQQRTVYLSLR